LEEITANKDRIIEDVHRRRTGAFLLLKYGLMKLIK